MGYKTGAELTAEARSIRRELESAQEIITDLRNELETETEARQQHVRQSIEDSLRSVVGWDDAFLKGLLLIRREANQEARDNAAIATAISKQGVDPTDPAYQPQDYFTKWEKEVTRAQELYNEENEKIANSIADLQERLSNLFAYARREAAARLRAEYPNSETADALEQDNPRFLVIW